MALEKIKKANDIKSLTPEEIQQLPDEIRTLLVDTLSQTGGHLASNLGAVELTIALHLMMDFPNDKIVWDVGHQSYTHKLLTGRKDEFKNLRQTDGLSGFPNPKESDCDAFIGGHASSSVSAALGMAFARDLKGEQRRIVAVMGDGALTGGMAYEALNNASRLEGNLTIILNDNNMSISKNVGGISARLSNMRTSSGYTDFKEDVTQSLGKLPNGDRIVSTIRRTKSGIKQLVIPGMFFEDMDIMYLGPVNGHDIPSIQKVLNEAFRVKGPVIVHLRTKKGKGFLPAERHPARFHGTDAFDPQLGIPTKKTKAGYTDVFATVMRKLGERDERIVAITAAMGEGTGLRRFSQKFPERFFDVGIAEEHAVTFAAALAKEGLRPVLAIYSTFLQRGFDQVLHDICIQSLPVILAIDRAGVVGKDGMTHQGAFDISYLSLMPGMVVMAPKNKWELSDMLKFAVRHETGPIAIRYPRGEAFDELKEKRAPIVLGCAEELTSEGNVLLFALGSMVKIALKTRDILREHGIETVVTNARFAQPLDDTYLKEAAKRFDVIVSMEENVASGGMGQRIENVLYEEGFKGTFLKISLPDHFISHGTVDTLFERLGLDADSVAAQIREIVR